MDFLISSAQEQQCLPHRYADKMRHGGTIVPGFTDLSYMPVLRSDRLAKYSFIWIVEYDVDFAGSWDSLFSQMLHSEADLIGTSFYPRADCRDWVWWKSLKAPTTVHESDFVRSFLPLARFSRRMINTYVEAVESENWEGHTEALYPSIARYHKLSIEDLGGEGPFTPAAWRGKNYFNTQSQDGHLVPGTFIPSPGIHSCYFHRSPDAFPTRGFLYHPVKVTEGLL
ncbi:MAG: hypothetical protein K2X60_09810 [Xanthobacteraceae bacterium]|nr:hypothetical protein [Xanthobacteraceae bacterium]